MVGEVDGFFIPWDQNAGFAENINLPEGLIAENVLEGFPSGSFKA